MTTNHEKAPTSRPVFGPRNSTGSGRDAKQWRSLRRSESILGDADRAGQRSLPWWFIRRETKRRQKNEASGASATEMAQQPALPSSAAMHGPVSPKHVTPVSAKTKHSKQHRRSRGDRQTSRRLRRLASQVTRSLVADSGIAPLMKQLVDLIQVLVTGQKPVARQAFQKAKERFGELTSTNRPREVKKEYRPVPPVPAAFEQWTEELRVKRQVLVAANIVELFESKVREDVVTSCSLCKVINCPSGTSCLLLAQVQSGASRKQALKPRYDQAIKLIASGKVKDEALSRQEQIVIEYELLPDMHVKAPPPEKVQQRTRRFKATAIAAALVKMADYESGAISRAAQVVGMPASTTAEIIQACKALKTDFEA